jgi:hypothetical protein
MGEPSNAVKSRTTIKVCSEVCSLEARRTDLSNMPSHRGHGRAKIQPMPVLVFTA